MASAMGTQRTRMILRFVGRVFRNRILTGPTLTQPKAAECRDLVHTDMYTLRSSVGGGSRHALEDLSDRGPSTTAGHSKLDRS